MRRKRIAQCGYGVLSGKVVYPAVAFGLPQHRDNGFRGQRALSIRAMRPETSPGPLVGMRVTSTEFISMAASTEFRSAARAEPDHEQRRVWPL